MAFRDFNFGFGDTDNSKTTFNNWHYYSKWIRALKNGLITIQDIWNNSLGTLLSKLPEEESIDPWIHGLDSSTLYTDSDATTSDTNYYNSEESRPNTVKEVFDNIYEEGVGGGGGPTTLAGDVTGESDANTVEKLRGRVVAATIPSDGEALVWSDSNSRWQPGEVASEVVTAVTMTGDVTGESDANTVAKIQGRSVASDAPSDGEGLIWDNDTSTWIPGTIGTYNSYFSTPVGYIHGFQLTYVDVETINVGVGTCKSDDGLTDLKLQTAQDIVMDDDLDTDNESANEWYYIWIFYNPTTGANSLKYSLQYPGSGTDPTAPDSGYTKKRYLGSVKNDGSGDFLEFKQDGTGEKKRYLWDANIVGAFSSRILNNGTSTSYIQCSYNPGSGTRYAYDFVPATSGIQYIRAVNNSSSGSVYIRVKGETTQNLFLSGYAEHIVEITVGTDQDLEYKVGGAASAYIEMYGYTESLSVSTIPDQIIPEEYQAATIINSYPTGYIHGLNLEYVGVASIKVKAGCCKSDDATTDMALLIDTTIVMPTDLDTGTESSDAWYYIWLFWNPTTGASSLKFSVQYPGSGTDPSAPAGYTKKRYIGSVRNDSGDFLYFTQKGNEIDRTYHYDTRQAQTGNLEPATPTAYAFSTAVPPTSNLMITHAWNIGGATEVKAYLYEYTDLVAPKIITYNNDIVVCDMVLNSSQQLYVQKILGTAGRGIYISAVGYKESLSVSTIPTPATAEAGDTITVSVYPPGWMFGLDLTYVDASSIEVKAGCCKSNDSTTDIALLTDTTIDLTTDLDVGTEASSTWYFVWIFYNPDNNTTSLKFSTQAPGSGTDPTAPDSGFTKKRYIGKVYNDSGDDIVEDAIIMDRHELQPNYISGLQMTFASTSTVTIGKGSCRDSTNSVDIHNADDITLTLSGATTGANYLDTGSETSGEWYYCYIIFNEDTETVATLLSISSTSPTLPSGYTHFRRIGTIRNHSDGHILDFVQTGDRDRTYLYNEYLYAQLRILANGTASSATVVSTGNGSYTDPQELVPPTAQYQYINIEQKSGTYSGITWGIGSKSRLFTAAGSKGITTGWILVGTGQDLEYYSISGAGSVYIGIRGFRELL